MICITGLIGALAFQTKSALIKGSATSQRYPQTRACFVDTTFYGKTAQPFTLAKHYYRLLSRLETVSTQAPKHIGPSMGRLPKLEVSDPRTVCIEKLSDTECLDLLYSLLYTIYCVRKNYDPAQINPSQNPNLVDTLQISDTHITMQGHLETTLKIIQHSSYCADYLCNSYIYGISGIDLIAGQGHYASLRGELKGLSLASEILLHSSLSTSIYTPSFKTSLEKIAVKLCADNLEVKTKIRIPAEEIELVDQVDELLALSIERLYPENSLTPLAQNDIEVLLNILEILVLRFVYLQQLSENYKRILIRLAPYKEHECVNQKLCEIDNFLKGNLPSKQLPDKNGDLIKNFKFYEKLLCLIDVLKKNSLSEPL